MTKIAIIEDDDDLRSLVRRNLEIEGYAVDESVNGQEVLDGTISADLFLIDIDLNGQSGLEVCLHLKSNLQTRAVPVILISANAEIESLSKEVMADDILPKPFNKGALLAKVRAYLDRSGDVEAQQMA